MQPSSVPADAQTAVGKGAIEEGYSEPGFGVFRNDDLAHIRAAVATAEQGTSGEIVTVITDATDDYVEALWRGGVVGAVFGLALATALAWINGAWGFQPLRMVVLPTVGGALAGVGLAWFSTHVRRFLAGADVIHTRVCDAAEAAFLEEGVFETRDRSGVLLFVALFERQAVVLADQGVHASVPQDMWVEVVERVGASMREGRAVEGVVEAIELCGRILRQQHVDRREDDTDELSDAPRLRPHHPPASEDR